MKLKFLLALLLFCVPPGCGPREIGQTAEEPDSGAPVAAELMRYPVTGANQLEKKLYYYNRPQVMEHIQELNRAAYLNRMGINPESPEYRSVPRQPSPFRE